MEHILKRQNKHDEQTIVVESDCKKTGWKVLPSRALWVRMDMGIYITRAYMLMHWEVDYGQHFTILLEWMNNLCFKIWVNRSTSQLLLCMMELMATCQHVHSSVFCYWMLFFHCKYCSLTGIDKFIKGLTLKHKDSLKYP